MAKLTKSKIESMKAGEIRKAAAAAGIETKGRKLNEIRDDLIASLGGGGAPKKGKGDDKPAKGMKKKKKAPPKVAEEEEEEEEEVAEKATKAVKGKKGKKAKAEPEAPALDLDSLTEQVLNAVLMKITPKMRDMDKRVSALESAASASSNAKPKADSSDEEKEAEEVPEELQEFVDEDGDLDISPEDVDGMKGKTLAALAAVLGVEFPEDAKNIRAKREFVKEALSGAGEGDDEEEEEEDEEDDEEEEEDEEDGSVEGPDGESAEPCTDWGELKKNDVVYIETEGAWVLSKVKGVFKDDDGDEYVHVICDDGDEAHCYRPEVNDDPILIGWRLIDDE